MIGSLNRHNTGKRKLIGLLRKEGDGLEARLRLRRAAHKGRIVIQAVVVGQIPERETVTEKKGLHLGLICRILIFLIQSCQFFIVGFGIGRVGIGVGTVNLSEIFGDHID